MYLERLLQINMATLAALGAMLLGMGERNVGPPLLVALAAAASVWLTDVTGWFRLGKTTANVLMLAAAAISLYRTFPVENELQALESAWFLIFLQVIILFQEKDARKYWLLVMISLLQVVVATLFNQGIWFGALLVIYMILGFFGMMLLMLNRELEPGEAGATVTGLGFSDDHAGHFHGLATVGSFLTEYVLPPPPPGATRFKVQEAKAFFAKIASWVNMPLVRLPAPAAVIAPSAPSSERAFRWSLLGQHAEFTCQSGGSGLASLNRDLLGRMARMVLHALALAAVLFFALPRFGQTTWRGPVTATVPVIGYSESVALGELGEIIENPDKVMQVSFVDPATRDPQPIQSEVYLQGAILMTYKNGKWQTGLPSWDTYTGLLEPPENLPTSGLVYQDFSVEALDHEELFFVPPFIALKATHEISYNHAQERLLRSPQGYSRRFGYKLGTTAIVDGKQLPMVPSSRRESTKRALQLPEAEDFGGGKSLPRLRQLAQQWVDRSGLPKSDRAGLARYLSQQFATSGKFQYSLVGQPRNPAIDPIEDFVSEHPQGHCEYFATALTLMLRSQGIPARLIVGYKCDEWNPMGKYFQVRQLHAHTWVEAYLYFHQIPPDTLHGKYYWPWVREGGWLRLDPTPGGGSAKRSEWMMPVEGAMDWLDATWSTYVRELDAETQRDAIYGPIARAAKAVYNFLTDPESWRTFFKELAAQWHLDQLSAAARWLLIAAAGVVIAAILFLVGWFVRQIVRRVRKRWSKSRGGGPQRSRIDFYRRWEAILARHGIWRSPGQTQREFAEMVGLRLAITSGNPQLAALPEVVAEAFYRVRFGGQPLDNLQAEKVEQTIQEFLQYPPAFWVAARRQHVPANGASAQK